MKTHVTFYCYSVVPLFFVLICIGFYVCRYSLDGSAHELDLDFEQQPINTVSLTEPPISTVPNSERTRFIPNMLSDESAPAPPNHDLSDLDALLQQRQQEGIPKCGKERDSEIHIPDHRNYVSYINRCKLLTNMSGSMEVYEAWINDKIGYMHNFKAGGTSIQDALESMVDGRVISRDSKLPFFVNKANPSKRPHRVHLYSLPRYSHVRSFCLCLFVYDVYW